MEKSVLVLGVGNVLMKDEAVGVRAIEELERRFRFPKNVELLDGGTSGIELLSYICNHQELIIIDAIKAGHPPGTVLRVEGEDVPAQFRTRISPHQLGISDLLAAATLTGELPGNLLMFGVEPKDVKLELGLSEEVKAGLDRMVGIVVEELRGRGFSVEPREDVSETSGSLWENIEVK